MIQKLDGGQAWSYMPPIILALGRPRQEDHHEFKVNLGYIVVSSRPV